MNNASTNQRSAAKTRRRANAAPRQSFHQSHRELKKRAAGRAGPSATQQRQQQQQQQKIWMRKGHFEFLIRFYDLRLFPPRSPACLWFRSSTKPQAEPCSRAARFQLFVLANFTRSQSPKFAQLSLLFRRPTNSVPAVRAKNSSVVRSRRVEIKPFFE